VVSLGLAILDHYFSPTKAKSTKSGQPLHPKGAGLGD